MKVRTFIGGNQFTISTTNDCLRIRSKHHEYLTEYTGQEAMSIVGELAKGDKFLEFHADEEQLQELVAMLYYELVDQP